MKTMKHLGVAAAFALLFSVAAADASAAGVALDASALPPAARTELTKEIARANAEVPELVKQVRDVAAHARDLDEASRLPGAPLTMHFKVLGPRAFGPMVDRAAYPFVVLLDARTMEIAFAQAGSFTSTQELDEEVDAIKGRPPAY